nr:UDP-N-acetylmuramoyl-L-alanine--D-glutamate ligase [uncultured Treponema sp.]
MIHTMSDIAGLTVTVMGLGLNGGGLASARFFAEHGAKAVIVTDMKTEQELAPSVAELRRYPNIRFALGGHRLDDFSAADIVIKNPGVKREGNPYLAAARCIETDISLFLRFSPAPILGVTGSKGKSSTVSALHYGLRQCGIPAFLGGNITVSPLTFLAETRADTPVVLELSSWQLGDLAQCPQFKPKIALLTTIMPDHQNWYGAMEPYVADKKIIYRNQDHRDYTICNYDDEWGAVFAEETAGRVFWYSTKPLPQPRLGAWIESDGSAHIRLEPGKDQLLLPSRIAVPGMTLKQNVMAASLALALYGVPVADIPGCMQNYRGIPHRLEFFYETEQFKFYNDSAATIPEAAAAAVNAFDAPIILITGGTDKKLDFTSLAPELKKAKALFLLAGTGTDKLTPLLRAQHTPFFGPYPNLVSLLHAVECEIDGAAQETVVFSPGATSFGMFKNEFDRGNCFKEAVRSCWPQGKALAN